MSRNRGRKANWYVTDLGEYKPVSGGGVVAPAMGGGWWAFCSAPSRGWYFGNRFLGTFARLRDAQRALEEAVLRAGRINSLHPKRGPRCRKRRRVHL